jgi:hypothetical protein
MVLALDSVGSEVGSSISARNTIRFPHLDWLWQPIGMSDRGGHYRPDPSAQVAAVAHRLRRWRRHSNSGGSAARKMKRRRFAHSCVDTRKIDAVFVSRRSLESIRNLLKYLLFNNFLSSAFPCK